MKRDSAALVRRLLDRGLLAPGEATGKAIALGGFPRRNGTYRLPLRGGRACFVKESRDGSGFLAREASLYRLARDEPTLPLARHLPEFRAGDRRTLILGHVDAPTVAAHAARFRRLSIAIARELGRSLAAVHASRPARAPLASAPTPWILSLGAPPVEMLRDMSAANRDLLEIVQKSTSLLASMERLASAWSPAALVHGDLRLENALVRRHARVRRPEITLVDWELSGWGEPAWDLGCVIASLLWLWLSSLPFVPGMTVERVARAAGVPLARIRPAMGAFWHSYVAARLLPPAAAADLRLSALTFAAVRLIQLSWESTMDASAIPGDVVCAVQVSLNMVRAPRAAAAELVPEAG